jgi:hypothetical protein
MFTRRGVLGLMDGRENAEQRELHRDKQDDDSPTHRHFRPQQ